jgi:hypothetical protein
MTYEQLAIFMLRSVPVESPLKTEVSRSSYSISPRLRPLFVATKSP